MNLQKTIRAIQPLDKTAMEQAAADGTALPNRCTVWAF